MEGARLQFFLIAEQLSPTREGAPRLGLVTLEQMIAALVIAVESSVKGLRIVTVPDIREARLDVDADQPGRI